MVEAAGVELLLANAEIVGDFAERLGSTVLHTPKHTPQKIRVSAGHF